MISKVILDKFIKNINQGVFEVLFKNLKILSGPEGLAGGYNYPQSTAMRSCIFN